MKIILKISLATLLASSSLLAAPKWIDPPRKNCTQNGGRLAEGGVCRATWENAGVICSSLGATLPTIEQLRKEVENCDGVINEGENNHNYPAYQSCRNKKGFSGEASYWSSTTDARGTSDMVYMVYFNNGNSGVVPKAFNNRVRCVQAGR